MTKEAIVPRAEGPSPTHISRTVGDAIKVTPSLGYRYLWVDKYCIDQADPQDLQKQLLQMGRIYACADATIVASAGNDANFGLPGVSKTLRFTPPPVKHNGRAWVPLLSPNADLIKAQHG